MEDLFQGLAAQCAQIPTTEDHGFFHRSARREMLREHLGILEKAAQPLAEKWNIRSLAMKGAEHPTKQSVQIMNPVERLPLPSTTIYTGGGTHQFARERDQIYDANSIARETLEERVASALANINSVSEMSIQQHTTVTQFWIAALKQLDDGDEEEFEDTVENEQDDEFTQGASASSPSIEAQDDGMPHFTMPAYSQAVTTAPRKLRRTYRPEQINFDFMKGWTDTRDQGLSTGSYPPPEEHISQLKNYRANKIRLSDFFHSNKVPKALDESIMKFNDDEEG